MLELAAVRAWWGDWLLTLWFWAQAPIWPQDPTSSKTAARSSYPRGSPVIIDSSLH